MNDVLESLGHMRVTPITGTSVLSNLQYMNHQVKLLNFLATQQQFHTFPLHQWEIQYIALLHVPLVAINNISSLREQGNTT